MQTLSAVSIFGYVIDDMTIQSISKNSHGRNNSNGGRRSNASAPRNSAIAISFFYCMVNHATERRN
eukprot:scaffold21618_cov63-Attheya_sp.AAC.6